jgi:hypothetical protein
LHDLQGACKWCKTVYFEEMLKQHAERLTRLASYAGQVYRVPLGVGVSGALLEFVDGVGDPVFDDGEVIVAATAEEIGDGTYLRLFSERALHAAATLKMLEIVAAGLPQQPE